MIVVSDTTAITNLYQVNRLHLLNDVFGEVLIPPAVERELAEMPGQLDAIRALNFIKVRTPKDSNAISRFSVSLDAGEAEAIALALEVKADYLVIDEWKGRRMAKQKGLHVIGLIGILLAAKRKGVVEAIKPILLTLTSEAGFRIHTTLLKDALRDAGESEL